MKSFMHQPDEYCSCDKSGIDLDKLAVAASFFSLIGEFLAFLGAVLALQQKEPKEDKKKKEIKRQIEEMRKELDKLYDSL